MITLTMTPAQFRQAFRTDRQCMKYIFERKYPEGFKCRKCGHEEYGFIKARGGSWQCKKCRYQESAKAETLFHKSKIPLKKWFEGIFEFTVSKGGISATELQARLGFGCYETAWQMLHKLRIAMSKRDQNYKLEDVIEFDGSSFGNRDKAKGDKKSKFYIAVENKTSAENKDYSGFAKNLKTDGFNRKGVKKFMEDHVKPESKVKTDGAWTIQDGAKDVDIELDSVPMYGFKGQLDKHLPWVHRLMGNIKAKLGGVYHGVSPKYVDRYIDEYLYRFNRRWWGKQLQTRMITACLESGPITYADTTR